MKFEIEQPQFNYTKVIKQDVLKECQICGSWTRWVDDSLLIPNCSSECSEAIWRIHLSSNPLFMIDKRYSLYPQEICDEVKFNVGENFTKDILIVVHNQLDYLKKCIDSIKKHTNNYNLYIWDNASDKETKKYLLELDAFIHFSDENVGFIISNNELAKLGKSEFVICINSDTEVFDGWDSSLCNFLHHNTDVGQVGCLGGLLESDGTGSYTSFGYDIDYVMGWCFCIRRFDYNEIGLFDAKLNFAYFEDVDLSLTIKSEGYKIYAFYTPLVHHYGGKTMNTIELDVMSKIGCNHAFIKENWNRYLSDYRVVSDRTSRIWGTPGKRVKVND